MVKAILRGGLIYPLGPLPEAWQEGQELRVEEDETRLSSDPARLDEWYAALESLCATGNREDQKRLGSALAQAHEEAKAQVRRQMGLPK